MNADTQAICQMAKGDQGGGDATTKEDSFGQTKVSYIGCKTSVSSGRQSKFEDSGKRVWPVRHRRQRDQSSDLIGHEMLPPGRITALRAQSPALRYGRQYFRPISGDQSHFAISTSNSGITSFSRILNDEEVIVVYNSYWGAVGTIYVIVDGTLNPAGSAFRLRYSNNPGAMAPQGVQMLNNVTVAEVDGSTGYGPVSVLPVQLGPTEVQILSR